MGFNPRASYIDRAPRKWPASPGSGSLWGYPSTHDAPRAVASAITRSSRVGGLGRDTAPGGFPPLLHQRFPHSDTLSWLTPWQTLWRCFPRSADGARGVTAWPGCEAPGAGAGALRAATTDRAAGARQCCATKWLTIPCDRCIVNHMVAHQADVLSRVFRALGDPTRREMLRQLSKCGRTVGELGAPFRMSRAATGKHVGVLEDGARARASLPASGLAAPPGPAVARPVRAFLERAARCAGLAARSAAQGPLRDRERGEDAMKITVMVEAT